MSELAIKEKFVYHASPIFRESDKEALSAWEARSFDEVVVFCKLHQSVGGVFGVGYNVVFVDGWSYGSFSEQVGKVSFEKACIKALFEILLHVKEESAKRVYVWTENKQFLEQISEESINKDKELRELHKYFESVTYSLVGSNEVENFDGLRESAAGKARFGSVHRTRRKRWIITTTVTSKKESAAEKTRRWEEITEIMAEAVIKHERRPIAEKILDAQNELKDLENNPSEEPNFEHKKQGLIDKILKLSEEQKKFEEALSQQKQKSEQLATKPEIKKDVCTTCGTKTKPSWKFCPNCAQKIQPLITST